MVKIPTPRLIKISELKPYPKNVKFHPKEQLEDISKLIDWVGFKDPIVIDSDKTIWAGHGRLEVAKMKKMEEVPCVFLEDLTEDQKKAFMLMDNRVNESPWNIENVQLLINEIPKIELEQFQMSFDQIIPGLDNGIREEKDDTPFVPETPKSKLGEIYLLGNHRLMCGDTLTDLPKLVGDHKCNLVFTDPPYNVAYEQGKYTGQHYARPKFLPILNDDQSPEDFLNFIQNTFTEVRKFVLGSPLYVCGPSMVDSYRILQGLINAGFHLQSQLIWKKEQFILGRADYHWRHEIIWYGYDQTVPNHYWCGDRTQDTIWEIDRKDKASYTHPTQKPVELSRRAILNSSREGDIVLDPFAGSGSTLISCEQTKRICYSMDLEPRYVDVIIERWENFTGKRAVRIDSLAQD